MSSASGRPTVPESWTAVDAPVTSAQRRLWFLHQLQPEDPAYNICLALELRGPLNPAMIRGAIGALTRRHDAQRSTFVLDGARPVRRVSQTWVPRPQLVDLGRAPVRTADLLAQLCARPFGLAAEPPVRWYLVRCGADRHVLVLTVHHVIFDGGCLPILCRELETIAAAHGRGLPSAVPDPGPRTYAGAHDRIAHDSGQDQHLAYWRAHLADPPAPFAIWPDPPPEPSAPGRGSTTRASVAAQPIVGERLARLRSASARAGVTPYMTLLATLAVVVARYTGLDDVVVGSPVSTRDLDAVEPQLDPSFDLLPLRVRPRSGLTFSALVRDVREVVLDALDHPVAFERIVEEARPYRGVDTSPLFQVLLAHQHAPTPPRLPGVEVEVLDSPVPAAKYHLTVTVTERRDRLELAVDAPASAADDAQVERFSRHLLTALTAAVDDPDLTVAHLPLALPEERVALTYAPVLDRRPVRARDATVHGLIERVAVAVPDAIAVDAGPAGQLSYGELYRRAGQIADDLRGRTSDPLGVVALHLQRTPHLLVGMLAVLKAGAAYLPLDPDQPRRRLAAMVADARPGLLLTDTACAAGLDFDGPVVRVDLEREGTVTPEAGPWAGPRPEDLAYVLYTSGSTGQPKGVGIEHRSAVGFLGWCGRSFARPELARVLATSSIGFDLSVFELFAPLCQGGTVVLTDGPGSLVDHPGVRQASLLNTVPSVVETLLVTGGLPSGLSTITLAGEPLRSELVDQVRDRRPGIRLGNLYGPTEATTYATAAWLDGPHRAVPVGTPVAGAEIWLVDAVGQPVPTGAVGEILIGGEALARGYLGRPALTAERFRPDHLGGRPGARLYETGDLGRLGTTGGLYFVGRRDNQVKVHGVRIELEEVEALLSQVDLVQDAAVAAVGRDQRSRRLAAVVCPSGDGLTTEDLVAHLRDRLPQVMTPTRWVFVDQLPRNANRKLDRDAIAAILARAEAADDWRSRAAPRTEDERAIAAIWSDVLGQREVGVHDAFFDIGGTSLLLLELHAALRRHVDPSLRLVDLFRCPTVASLAGLVRDRSTGDPASLGRRRGASRLASAGRRSGARRVTDGTH
jgi:amino acid adenylation domain-containing protein